LIKWLDNPIKNTAPSEQPAYSKPAELQTRPPIKTVTSPPANDPALIDLTEFASMLDDDVEEMQRFLSIFLDSMQQGLHEMDAAFSQQDYVTVRRVAHKIKSAAKTVGAMGFANLCQTLEALNDTDAPMQAAELIAQLHQLLLHIEAQLKLNFSIA
jgi:two-component system, sensor histidine kinase and response regulator